MAVGIKLKGHVVEGNKRGKSLGFPTLNIAADSGLSEGIYVSQIKIDNKIHNSITFIGRAITYGEVEFKAETYVFDFDESAYGKEVEIFILKKIRNNQKFGSEEELIEQMEKDRQYALKYFKESE